MDKEKLFIALKAGIIAAVICFLAGNFIVSCQNNKMLKDFFGIYGKANEKIAEIAEEEIFDDGKVILNAEKENFNAMEILLNSIAGMREDNASVRWALNRLTEERRDNEILGMLSEKFVNDFTDKGMQYFNDFDYVNAASAFNEALRYKQDNTTLIFYSMYSSYLAKGGSENMQETLLELREKGFREEELLFYTIDEMEKRLDQINFNLNTERKQDEKENEEM